LRRITADSTSSQLNNKTYFKSYTEIIDAKLSYPNSAIVGVRVDASQFNSVPKRGYDAKLLKIRIPTNATVRADGSLSYSGTWDGTFQVAWSCCPAWCFYDLVTQSRYGLGNYVPASQVDKWALYAISQYCNTLIPDGFGGTEPRFALNVWINTRQEAFKLVAQLASAFRGMVYWGTGSITASQDAPHDPTYLFTNANVVDGLFEYQGSSAKARHTVALVSYTDPKDMYRTKVEYVEDSAGIARYGVVPIEVTAFGCASRGQAHRLGRWTLYSERYETEVVTFKTGLEGALCSPGSVIKIADQYRAGSRIGGRISSATTTSVTVDSLNGVAVSGGTIYIIGPNGTVYSSTITSVSGNTVNVSPAFAVTPQAQSQWIITTPALDAQTFRVLSMVENDNGEIEISALANNQSKYGYVENNLTLQNRNITDLSPVPANVTSVSMSESLYRYQNDVRSKITITWPAATSATAYKVEWRKDSGNWQSDVTSAVDYEILNTTIGKYDVKVTAIGVFGTPAKSATTSSINALGKTAPPSDVTGFTAVIDPLIGITLSWTNVSDLDLAKYEIRQGASWAAGTVVTQVAANTYKLGAISGTSQTFWIKAIDTTGNYSTNATSITTALSAPSAVTVTSQVIDNNVLLKWSTSAATLAIDYYEIRKGTSWAAGTVVGRVSNATFVALFETASGSYTYWIAGVDIGGNYGTASSVTATVAQPPDYVLFLNYTSSFGGTLSNAIKANGALVLPVDTTTSFQNHFTNNAWASPQAQVTAGYPLFIEPSLSAGYYEEVIDYGSTLASCKVTVNATYTTVAGTPTVTPKISVSNTSATGPWTDYAGVTSVYATSFRYIKIRYDVTGTGGTSLVQFTGITVSLDAKAKTDQGTITAVSTDTGGTVVNFNTSFTSVTSISVTPQGTSARYAIYDFAGGANPTSFKVLLYDSAGNRLSGAVSWTARGY
jgi:predicted phage tail protein